MKRKSIVMTTFLASIWLLIGLNSHGFNHEIFEKVSATNVERRSGARSTSVKHEIAYGQSGTIFLQLEADDWKSSDSKIALYMSDSDSNEAWGGFVMPGSSRFVEYTFYLEFVPTKCIAFKFTSDVKTKNLVDDAWVWADYEEADEENLDDRILFKTQTIDFGNVVSLGNVDHGKWTAASSYNLGDVAVIVDSSDEWEGHTDTYLNMVMVNSSDNLELYVNINLESSTYLFIYSWIIGDRIGQFEAHPSIAKTFSNSTSGAIHNSEIGSYDVYYDYLSGKVYITTSAHEAADEYGEYFLSETASYCTSDISTETQSELKGNYNQLDNKALGAKAAFCESEIIRGKDIEYPCPASEALSRYVNMQEAKGYTDFLGINSQLTSSSYNNFENRNYGATIVIILASTATITALGTLILLKKRKQF